MSSQYRQGVQQTEVSSGSAKSAFDTPGLSNTTARETSVHNVSANVTRKETKTHKPFGALGAKGHGG